MHKNLKRWTIHYTPNNKQKFWNELFQYMCNQKVVLTWDFFMLRIEESKHLFIWLFNRLLSQVIEKSSIAGESESSITEESSTVEECCYWSPQLLRKALLLKSPQLLSLQCIHTALASCWSVMSSTNIVFSTGAWGKASALPIIISMAPYKRIRFF